MEKLLLGLSGAVVRATELAARASEASVLPIGITDLDHLIGGGLPVGRCSEFFGGLSGGSTHLAVRLMSEATAAGCSVAWIDTAGALDPESCCGFGGNLANLLWVRSPEIDTAWAAAEILLTSGDFPLVVLDGRIWPQGIFDSRSVAVRSVRGVWVRLSRAVAKNHSVLLLLSGAHPQLEGIPPAVRLACRNPSAIWSTGREEQRFLLGIESEIEIHRAPSGAGRRLTLIL